jgi:hypothetical protein
LIIQRRCSAVRTRKANIGLEAAAGIVPAVAADSPSLAAAAVAASPAAAALARRMLATGRLGQRPDCMKGLNAPAVSRRSCRTQAHRQDKSGDTKGNFSSAISFKNFCGLFLVSIMPGSAATG